MMSSRQNYYRIKKLKHIFFAVLTGILIFIFFYLPPSNDLAVAAFVILASVNVYIGSSYFLSVRKRFILTAFFFSALILSYLIGFDIVNTILLLSFIIVAVKLIPSAK